MKHAKVIAYFFYAYQVKCVFATVAVNLEFEDAAMEMKEFLTLIYD